MSNFGSYSDQPYGSYHSGAPPSGGREHDFNRLATVIGNNVQKISRNVNDVQTMVTQIGTSRDNTELRDKLHNVQHYTNRVAQETNGYMKQLHGCPNLGSQSEQRQRKIQKERLMNEFSAALKKFQDVQRDAASKEKDSVARARASSGSNYDPFRDDPKKDSLIGLDSPGTAPQQQITMEQDVDVGLIQEREQAIHKLESDIMDVNQIFKDLGMLVHEQGEVIDSIEANVENASVHVEQGTSELQKSQRISIESTPKEVHYPVDCDSDPSYYRHHYWGDGG